MFIKIGNLKVHYKVAGCGDSILLLHGWGCSAEHFFALQKHLAKQFTVYAIDLPGFGLSTIPEGIWGGAEYADLIAQFINATKIINPILIGHSFGGKIIINLVARNLVRAKKIILISSAGVRLPRPLKLTCKIYSFKLLKTLAHFPVIRNIFGVKFELYKRKFGSEDYRNSNGLMRAILVTLVNENIVTLLPQIKVPTLLLWGGRDTSTPLKASQIMQQLIPEAELTVFPDSGHFPFLDNYEELIIKLDNFLR